MAYMSQEKKARIAPVVKAICKKYGIKASLSVDHHTSLVLSIKSGSINFFEELTKTEYNNNGYVCTPVGWYTEVNVGKYGELCINSYHYKDHYIGKSLKFLSEVISAMNEGNHDRSDSHTDYFDVGWYISVNIGKYKAPYVLQVQA